MRARIFDKASQTFYRSEIYGIVNFGGDRYIAGKCEGGKQIFYLIDYLDYTSEPPYRVNVECIDSNPLPEGMQWEYRQKEELLDLNLILEKNTIIRRYYLSGDARFYWSRRNGWQN